MAERAITAAELVAGLHDIRLPPEAPGGFIAELAAAAAIGLLIALAAGFLLSLIAAPSLQKRPPRARPDTLARQIQVLRALPDDDRTIALLRLLKSCNPKAAATLEARLYRPGGLPSIASLESALTKELGGDD